jgi:hypothetical protein
MGSSNAAGFVVDGEPNHDIILWRCQCGSVCGKYSFQGLLNKEQPIDLYSGEHFLMPTTRSVKSRQNRQTVN